MSTPPTPQVAILGAGSAGLRAYRAARRWTDDVLLIDPGPLGTTCARVGCMPSKLLLAAAHAAHEARGAWRFGVDAERQPEVDGRAVMRRVRAERDRFVGFSLPQVPEDHLIRQRAVFEGDGRLRLEDGTALHPGAVVLATGSRPRVLPFLQGLGDRLVLNDDVFDWDDLPESVAVFGPGVVGLELGQALHRLGVRVRVFGVGGLVGPLTDPEVRAAATEAFAQEFPLDPDATVHEVRREGDTAVVRFDHDGRVTEETFTFVLAATGRVPNTDRLGLEHLGLDPRHLDVDPETLQVADHALFLAGDALGTRPVLHEAADEGSVAGDNAARWPHRTRLDRRSPLAIVFSDPQIALVGSRWADVAQRDPVVGRVDFGDQGRSRVMLRNAGRAHVYVDPQTGRFLGAELVGPDAEHLAHLLAWVHQLGLTATEILDLPFYHPVVEEGLRTAFRDAASQLAATRAA